ncbi:uncharacterized protein [Penaeus vannamei]|uniref:uncharacterized protein n=1 Tax=Penaeus vannamei TaxID=6689 RepID=UPI00387F8F71
MAAQREKQIHLSEDQRESILSLIAEHKSAILGKMHDPASITKKQEAWEKVTGSFNALYPHLPPRNTSQLKRAFEYIRTKVKKEHSLYIRKRSATGGGPPPTPPRHSPLAAAASLLMENELAYAEKQYDSAVSQYASTCIN